TLMSEDLPTLERPENATWGRLPGAGPPRAAIVPAYSTVVIFIRGAGGRARARPCLGARRRPAARGPRPAPRPWYGPGRSGRLPSLRAAGARGPSRSPRGGRRGGRRYAGPRRPSP